MREFWTAHIICHPIQFWPEDTFWIIRIEDPKCKRESTDDDGEVIINPTEAQKREAIERYFLRAHDLGYDSCYLLEVVETRSRPYLLSDDPIP